MKKNEYCNMIKVRIINAKLTSEEASNQCDRIKIDCAIQLFPTA